MSDFFHQNMDIPTQQEQYYPTIYKRMKFLLFQL